MGKIALIAILLVFFSTPLISKEYQNDEDDAFFSGRISRLNRVAHIMRVKVDFENAKFLNNKDRIEFWNETYPDRRCMAYLEAKSNEYLLLKVPSYNVCINKVGITTGTYLHFFSPDLDNSLKIAKDLVTILMKKRLALEARLERFENEVESYVEKMDAVNKRYEILRQKMEIEWQKELSALEDDKTKSYMNYKHSQARLNELDHKIQKYRVQDQNLYEDRWSLDPKLYYKK
jgi:hypothetical protein